MATITWTGNGFPDQWLDDDNWSDIGGPQPGDTAVFPSGFVLTFGGISISDVSLNVSGTVTLADTSALQGGSSIVGSGGVLIFGNGISNSSYNDGTITIESGGICTFDNSSYNDGTITIESGGTCAIANSSYNNGTLTITSGGMCMFNSGSYNVGEITGAGEVEYDRSSLWLTLNGNGRAGTALNTRYPTNFGGGTL